MSTYGPKNPQKRVKILKPIDVTQHQRYKHAALIQVKGGRGDLCRKGTARRYRVMLENEPLCEVRSRDDPSIHPMLNSGESTKALLTVRESMQKLSGKNFTAYVKACFPILASLNDGYYLILDALLYPATGNPDFFMEIDGDTPMEALRAPEKNRPSPAYIYPTVAMPPFIPPHEPNEKAIAYYLEGYLSLLLSGHNLAVEAAINGDFLSALVIVPCTSVTGKGAYFADIFLENMVFSSQPEAYRIIPGKLMRSQTALSKLSQSHCGTKYRHLWKQYPLIDNKHEIESGMLRPLHMAVATPIPSEVAQKYPRYKGIASVHVRNGKSQLCKKGFNGFHKFYFKERPFAQVYDFWDDEQTHIAPAYGFIEDSPEIKAAVQNIAQMNSQSIEEYGLALAPVLELLPDGDYVLVDTMLYPSTGASFFWNVKNAPSRLRALDEPEFGFPHPAYLYPTAHPGCYKPSKNDTFACARMLDESNPGRAICYYLQSYMTALLYGHGMAAMAAFSFKELPALVIIPYCDLVASNNKETLGRYADIVLPIANADRAEAGKVIRDEAPYKTQPEIGPMPDWPRQYLTSWRRFPNPEQLMSRTERFSKYG